MPNILLTRIDNRLIHGQVATQWSKIVGANLLLVANDEVAHDEFRQSLMDMAAPHLPKHAISPLIKQSMSFIKQVTHNLSS